MAKTQNTVQESQVIGATDVGTADPLDTSKETAAPAAKKAAFQFKVKKHVTLPLLKILDDVPVYIRVESAIEKAKEIAATRTRSDAAPKQPPELIHVIDLETGEHAQIIANAVLASTFRDEYPDNGYIGKSFQVIRHKMREGKNYATFSVTEIEV